MSDEQHGPEPRHAAADGDPYARPSGSAGGFDPPAMPPAYTPPPPTVSPQEEAVFGRRPGGGPFAPAPGERLEPRVTNPPEVAPVFEQAFGTAPGAREGFAPAPGDRIAARGPEPASPWWRPGADRDPWRDPATSFWLGRGAVFTGGRAEQVDPDADTVAGDLPLEPEADVAPAPAQGRRFGLPTLIVTLVVALVAGAVGGGIGWVITSNTGDALHRPDVSIAQAQNPVSRKPGSVAGVAKRVGPSVVSIAVQTPSAFGIGSGVVIDRDGDVLTNNHVVSAAASGGPGTSIVVTFSNESTARARIVGRDPVSDLAVLKVPTDELTVATLGDSDKLAVGDPVIAIGSPLGLQGTVTSGIVSALDRPVHVYSDDGSSDAYLNAIQTDAPINPGNSGGALVDSGGAVIGINSAAALGSSGPNGSQTATSGIGYAIPIDYARRIALELIHTGKASHASLGAQGVTTLSGVQVGAYIKQVSPGGPADRAGLAPGDVVVVADHTAVQSFDQLTVLVQQHRPGDRLPVTYYRKNSSSMATTTVTLG